MKRKIDIHDFDALIFDLGGVILNIDYLLTKAAFENLGVDDFNSVYSQAKQDNVFDLFEKGMISESEFRATLRKYIDKKVDDAEIDNAWNAMLLDLPLERMVLIKSLAQHKRIFLLSNTNSIHISAFYKILAAEGLLDQFEQLFEKIYYSHKIGLRKPDAEVYLHILNDAGLKPETTLFIDDSKQHVLGARACDINATWLEKGDITELF